MNIIPQMSKTVLEMLLSYNKNMIQATLYYLG